MTDVKNLIDWANHKEIEFASSFNAITKKSKQLIVVLHIEKPITYKVVSSIDNEREFDFKSAYEATEWYDSLSTD